MNRVDLMARFARRAASGELEQVARICINEAPEHRVLVIVEAVQRATEKGYLNRRGL